MAFYYTCEYCGANLDPGEYCDCMEREKEKTRTDKHTGTGLTSKILTHNSSVAYYAPKVKSKD